MAENGKWTQGPLEGAVGLAAKVDMGSEGWGTKSASKGWGCVLYATRVEGQDATQADAH